MSTMKKINKEKGEHMRKTILIMTLLLAVSLTGCGTTQNKNSETTVAKSMTENDYNKAVEKLTDKSAYQTIVCSKIRLDAWCHRTFSCAI